MKRLSWKYIAGLVDGEGCIDSRLFRDKRMKHKPLYILPRVRITLSDNCLFILDMFKANHGGCLEPRNLSRKNPDWQDCTTWSLQGTKLRPFLQNIANHMYIKREQALLAIWIQDHLRKQGMQFSEDPKQCACKEMKAMKADPQRLSEAAIRKIENTEGYHFWSTNHNQCIDCGTTEKPHEAKGRCRNCHQKYYRKNKTD